MSDPQEAQIAVQGNATLANSVQGVPSVLDVLLSEDFRGMLNEIEKGDPKRALGLYRAGGQFYLDYRKTNSMKSLDHAISFTEEALETLPKPHDKAAEYATILAVMLQDKASLTGDIHDTDRYIEAIQMKIDLAVEGPLVKEGFRELGSAYYSRFDRSNDMKDLNQAIEILQECITSTENVHPQVAFYLGGALHHRFGQSGLAEDLDRAIDLQQTALEVMGSNHAMYSICLMNLIRSCQARYDEKSDPELLDRLISNAERAMARISTASPESTWLSGVLIKALMVRYFRKPGSPSEMSAALSSLEIVESEGLQIAKDRTEMATGKLKLLVTLESLFHSPLDDSKRDIRLTELLPGSIDDEISCRLFTVSLNTAPEYEALSYMWGDLKDTRAIYVNQTVHNVTSNLHSALTRLRSQTTPRMLWIDAICIDQKNLKEKQKQIALMRDIFKTANEVILWLGEPKSESSGPVEAKKTGRLVTVPAAHDDLDGVAKSQPSSSIHEPFGKGESHQENVMIYLIYSS
jgi:tetratricopeptide (TPR) repeat protein